MFDKDVGVNWHLRFRLKLEKLEKENEYLKMKNRLLTRKIKKYENNNIRTTRNREDNNSVEPGRSVHTTRG
jgi:cell division protein FtsB